jgi:hypothetical protein
MYTIGRNASQTHVLLCDFSFCIVNMLIYVCIKLLHHAQSLEVSKIKKNKKNFEKFWSSIINKGSYEMRFLRQHVKIDEKVVESSQIGDACRLKHYR